MIYNFWHFKSNIFLLTNTFLRTNNKIVVYICLLDSWKWALYVNSVLTVGRRPSSTAAGTPATVTTPVNRSTGPPTCQCVCRPRIMPPTPGAPTLNVDIYSQSEDFRRATRDNLTNIIQQQQQQQQHQQQHRIQKPPPQPMTTTTTTSTTTQNPETPAPTYDKRTVPVERGS